MAAVNETNLGGNSDEGDGFQCKNVIWSFNYISSNSKDIKVHILVFESIASIYLVNIPHYVIGSALRENNKFKCKLQY